jgi:hypothetical protein
MAGHALIDDWFIPNKSVHLLSSNLSKIHGDSYFILAWVLAQSIKQPSLSLLLKIIDVNM